MKIGIILNETNEIIGTLIPPAEDDMIVDCNKEDIFLGTTKYVNGELLNPSAEEMSKLRAEEELRKKESIYENKVIELIRKKYSLNQELAILRQRDTKPEEYAAYNAYAEQCKATAKAEILEN